MGGIDAKVVPFNRPYSGQTSLQKIAETLGSTHHSGDGPMSREVADRLQEMLGVERVFLTPSGTDSLEMAFMTLGIGPEDEVVVPSFTFSSVATAAQRTGATLRFADVNPLTLGMDLKALEKVYSPQTKAVVLVHYAGQARDLEEILIFCRQRGLAIVEDAAHSLGGFYDGRPLGTFGAFGCFSFHETKNLSCGEGGALAVNQVDKVDLAEIVREKGTDRSKFFRGQVDKYTWVGPGSSFLLSDISAAVLSAGLDDWSFTQGSRSQAWNSYQEGLRGFCSSRGFAQPDIDPRNAIPHHIYYLLAPNSEARDELLKFTRSEGVMAVSHYQPLANSSQGVIAMRGAHDECPVSEHVADCLIRLPLFSSIRDDEVARVIEVVNSWH